MSLIRGLGYFGTYYSENFNFFINSDTIYLILKNMPDRQKNYYSWIMYSKIGTNIWNCKCIYGSAYYLGGNRLCVTAITQKKEYKVYFFTLNLITKDILTYNDLKNEKTVIIKYIEKREEYGRQPPVPIIYNDGSIIFWSEYITKYNRDIAIDIDPSLVVSSKPNQVFNYCIIRNWQWGGRPGHIFPIEESDAINYLKFFSRTDNYGSFRLNKFAIDPNENIMLQNRDKLYEFGEYFYLCDDLSNKKILAKMPDITIPSIIWPSGGIWHSSKNFTHTYIDFDVHNQNYIIVENSFNTLSGRYTVVMYFDKLRNKWNINYVRTEKFTYPERIECIVVNDKLYIGLYSGENMAIIMCDIEILRNKNNIIFNETYQQEILLTCM